MLCRHGRLQGEVWLPARAAGIFAGKGRITAAVVELLEGEVCGGVSNTVSNACVLCNCGIKMTKGEDGLLITNSNVSYCVQRDPKR